MRINNMLIKMRIWKHTRNVKKTALSCGSPIKANGKCVVNNKTVLGNNVNFNGLTVIGAGEVYIGDNFHSGQGCYIITQNHDYDNGECIPYSACHSTEARVVIEDNVWLGIGVIILPGVTIGEGAIIQAGSVVTKDIPKYGIAGGHPATVFKLRDKAHYEKLKEEKKFF